MTDDATCSSQVYRGDQAGESRKEATERVGCWIVCYDGFPDSRAYHRGYPANLERLDHVEIRSASWEVVQRAE